MTRAREDQDTSSKVEMGNPKFTLSPLGERDTDMDISLPRLNVRLEQNILTDRRDERDESHSSIHGT